MLSKILFILALESTVSVFALFLP